MVSTSVTPSLTCSISPFLPPPSSHSSILLCLRPSPVHTPAFLLVIHASLHMSAATSAYLPFATTYAPSFQIHPSSASQVTLFPSFLVPPLFPPSSLPLPRLLHLLLPPLRPVPHLIVFSEMFREVFPE